MSNNQTPPTQPGLTIPNPHVAKLRAISNRIAGTFPQCAADLSDIAVEMARMVRRIAALEAALKVAAAAIEAAESVPARAA